MTPRKTSARRFDRVRRLVVLGLGVAAIGTVAGCASDGTAKSEAGSGSSASSPDKICGRRSDVDCDPRNRQCAR